MAELGLVGDGPNSYQIWLGGASNQTRLAETFMDRVKLDKLESVLEPVFYMWKSERHEKEGFGDFVYRQVLLCCLVLAGRSSMCEFVKPGDIVHYSKMDNFHFDEKKIASAVQLLVEEALIVGFSPFESFMQQGFGACKTYIENYTGPRKPVRRGGLFLDADVHSSLAKLAADEGLTVSKFASKVLAEHLEKAQH